MSRLSVAIVLGAAGLAAPLHAQAVWTGLGDGVSWTDPANWSTLSEPNSAAVDVFIDSTGMPNFGVVLNTSRSANELTIGAGDQLRLDQGANLSLNGTLTNNGTLLLNALNTTAAGVFLNFIGAQTITGTGEIVLSDDPNNIIQTTNAILTLGAQQTIRGSGLLVNNSGGMINNGSVRATGVNALAIDPGAGFSFMNNNELIAEGAGGLQLNGGLFINNTEIVALNGSVVDVGSGAEIQGGTLRSVDFGFINASVNSSFTGVSLAVGSTLRQGQSQSVQIRGGLVNNGHWEINSSSSTASSTLLSFIGSQALTGSGEIVMSDDPNNIIQTTNETLTIGAGQTIRGAGTLINNSGGAINNGSIFATGANALTIDPGAGFDFVHNGIMQAQGSGGIFLAGGVYDNNATIDVLSGSKLRVGGGAVVNGGLIRSAGTGFVQVDANADFNGVTIAAGTLVQQAQSQSADITGGLVNNGRWEVNSSGATSSNTLLSFLGSQVISGSGEIVLSNDADNIIQTSNEVLTLGSDQTIRGGGTIVNNSGGFVNNGTILAQGSAGLFLNPGAGFTFENNATMRAEAGSRLVLGDGIFMNNTTIEAMGNGASIVVNGNAEVRGGHLNASGDAFVQINANADLTGVTIDSGTLVRQAQSQSADITGGLVNNGRWEINSSGATSANTLLSFLGSQTISGNGEIVLSDDADNIIQTTNQVLTLGSDQTIRGGGTIVNNSGGFVNDGTILAQGSSGLFLNPGAGFTFENNATMRAEAGSRLVLGDGIFMNNTTIEAAGPGASVVVGGNAEVRGGRLNASSGAFVQINANADLAGVTIDNGTLVRQMQSQSAEIRDGLVNNGRWEINSSGATTGNTTLAFIGSQTISGSGELVLSDDVDNFITSANSTLTNDTQHTIRGAGRIVNNSGGFTNLGTVLAVGVNDLSIDIGSGFSLVNAGTFGGTGRFVFVDGSFSNDGTIDIGSSIGTLAMVGDVTQNASASLLAEIASDGSSDLLAIDGDFTAGGMIVLDLFGGGSLDPTDEFVVVQADSISGNFANAIADSSGVAIGVRSNGLTFDVIYAADSIRITNVVPAPGAAALACLAAAGSVVRRRPRG